MQVSTINTESAGVVGAGLSPKSCIGIDSGIAGAIACITSATELRCDPLPDSSDTGEKGSQPKN